MIEDKGLPEAVADKIGEGWSLLAWRVNALFYMFHMVLVLQAKWWSSMVNLKSS